MSVSKLKQYWMERKQEKLLRNMEDQQSEYNKIKKSTNVLFNVILTILSLLSVILVLCQDLVQVKMRFSSS